MRRASLSYATSVAIGDTAAQSDFTAVSSTSHPFTDGATGMSLTHSFTVATAQDTA